MRPILIRSWADLSLFYLPACLGLIAIFLFSEVSSWPLVTIFVFSIVDAGHVYTTFLRTLLNPRMSEKKYVITPFIVFLLMSALFFASPDLIWKIVVYATFFHHVRQVYGVNKWYQRINGRFCLGSDRFLYALALLPFVIYHLRSGVSADYYSSMAIFLFPWPELLSKMKYLYTGVILAWLIFEWTLRSREELNRFLAIAFPALIYGVAFLNARTSADVLLPLILLHGSTYFSLMTMALMRTRGNHFKRVGFTVGVISLVAVVFGLLDGLIGPESGLQTSGVTIFSSILVGLSLTPLMCHYVYDMWIWKKSHSEAELLFLN